MTSQVRHADANEGYVVLNGERGPQKGITLVLNAKNIDPKTGNEPLETVLKLEGLFRYGHAVGDNLYVLKKNILNRKELDKWKELKKANPELRREDKPKKQMNFDACVYDLKNGGSPITKLLEQQSDVIASFSNRKDLVCSLYLDRTFLAINANTLEILVRTKIAGVGAILSGAMVGNSFYLSPKRDNLLKFELDKVKDLPEVFDFEKATNESVKVMTQKFSGIESKNFTLNWVKPDEILIIMFEGQFNVINFATGKTEKKHYYEITCCGLGLSHVLAFIFY